jgi:hypothetical protein
MSGQTCQAGDTQGFPIKLSQKALDPWPGVGAFDKQIQSMYTPYDFSISWGPTGTPVSITATYEANTRLQIRGFDAMATGTTLTYGTAHYSCSNVLSITRIQHPTLAQGKPLYEAILAFTINDKQSNPSAPHLILMCRPLNFVESYGDSTWGAINEAIKKGGNAHTSNLNIPNFFQYSNGVMMPALAYTTCLPVKVMNGGTNTVGSLRTRVIVVHQPMNIVSDSAVGQKCQNISRYLLNVEPRRLTDMMPGSGPAATFQFKDGLGEGGFPAGSANNYFPLEPSTQISDFNTVVSKFDLLLPNEFMGKSLDEINSAAPPPAPKASRKAFKCYRINPEKDIKDDQILVDPTTGETLQGTMRQDALDAAGGDPVLAAALNGTEPQASGIMPGDVQQILAITFTVLGAVFLAAYLGFIVHTALFRKNISGALTHLGVFAGMLVGLVFFAVAFTPDEKS